MGLVQPDGLSFASAPGGANQTWGIDRFFSSLAGRSKKGLSAEVLGIVATGSRRAFGVDATQTPPDLSKSGADGHSRVDFYLEQIIDLYDRLAGLGVSYWVTGGFYAKQKVFDTVTDLGGDLITRLRSDANLRQATAIYTGAPKDGPSRPKQYDGKIDWDDRETLTRRFDEVDRLPDQPERLFENTQTGRIFRDSLPDSRGFSTKYPASLRLILHCL